MKRMTGGRYHEMQVIRDTYVLLTSILLTFVAILWVLSDESRIAKALVSLFD